MKKIFSVVALAGVLVQGQTVAVFAATLDGILQGQWSGVTDQGYEVTFSITGTTINSFTIKYELDGYYCNSTTTQSVYYKVSNGDSFSITGSNYNSETYTYDDYNFAGTLSGGSVSGTWSAENSSCGAAASGTWSAQLVPDPTTTTATTTTTTTTDAATTTTNGSSVTTTTIPGNDIVTLTPGWNLVGLKGTEAVAVGDLGQVISVWKWTTVNGVKTWAVYLPNDPDSGASYAASKGFGLIETIDPGEGFWVNAGD